MRKLMLLCAWLCAMAFTMTRLLSALAIVLALVMRSAPAEAATLLHTWVSNSGNDTNSCAITAPCATFGGAYANTSAGGEITCLNSGDFGGLNITQSITINCESTLGGTALGNGFNNFAVFTTASTDVVVLRGLDIDGVGQGSVTCFPLINFAGAGVLHVQKTKVNHMVGFAGGPPGLCSGIYFAATGSATLDITDSDITDNGSSGSTNSGIYIRPSSGAQATVTITRTQVQGNNFGIVADGTSGGTIRGTISDSVVSGNAQNGITASTSGSGSAVLIIDQTKVSGNGNHGLAADGSGAGMLVRNTSVFNNAAGLFTENGATLYSYGNNSVNGNNGNDGSFTGTIGLK
jgi:hypothetical protein